MANTVEDKEVDKREREKKIEHEEWKQSMKVWNEINKFMKWNQSKYEMKSIKVWSEINVTRYNTTTGK